MLFHSAAKIERLRAEREAAGESLWTTQLTGAARTRLWQCVRVTMGDRRKEGTEIVRAITAERTDALFRLHIGRSVLMGQRRTGPWSVLENFFFTSASDDDALTVIEMVHSVVRSRYSKESASRFEEFVNVVLASERIAYELVVRSTGLVRQPGELARRGRAPGPAAVGRSRGLGER